MLANAHDEALFAYYATSRIDVVDARSGSVARTPARGIYTSVSPSPDGRYLLAERVHAPFSYLFPYERFPHAVDVLDARGAHVKTVADLPLADRVPADGVPTGPRDVAWKPSSPATLAWPEALDGGDPRRDAPARDRIVMLAAPFTGAAGGAGAHAGAHVRRHLARPRRARDRDDVRQRDAHARDAARGRAQPRAPRRACSRRCATATCTTIPARRSSRTPRTATPSIGHAGDAIWLRGAGLRTGRAAGRSSTGSICARTRKRACSAPRSRRSRRRSSRSTPTRRGSSCSASRPTDPPNVFVRTRVERRAARADRVRRSRAAAARDRPPRS